MMERMPKRRVNGETSCNVTECAGTRRPPGRCRLTRSKADTEKRTSSARIRKGQFQYYRAPLTLFLEMQGVWSAKANESRHVSCCAPAAGRRAGSVCVLNAALSVLQQPCASTRLPVTDASWWFCSDFVVHTGLLCFFCCVMNRSRSP